jgi:GNAT superfamily N-acetyltransferase
VVIEQRGIEVRPARRGDRGVVLEIVERLAAFGPPAWRRPADIVEGEARTLRAFFDHPPPRATLLVAESARLGPVGFVFLEEARDYFTLASHGHIGIIAVSERAEGTGAGSALMRAAEAWASARHYPILTLNVFEDNHRARRVYEHFGFRPDTIKYLKPL